MAAAPYCNVKIATPPGDPQTAGTHGIQRIPNNANLQQVINILNNNFSALIKGNFREDRGSRQSRVTRIYNPADSTQFVDVREIVGLNFFNPLTGQTLQFRR